MNLFPGFLAMPCIHFPNICNMFTTPNLYFYTENINPVYIKGMISEDIYVPRGIVENMALPSSALKKVQDASKTIIAQKWNCCSCNMETISPCQLCRVSWML